MSGEEETGTVPELETTELIQAVLELEPSGVAVLSGQEHWVQLANPAFRAAIPTPQRDPVGRKVEEIWPGDVGRRIRTIADRVLASGEPALHERYAHTAEDGVDRVFAFHVKRLPVRCGPGLLVVVWDTSDVEEARRAAERARERAELLAAMAGELSGGAELDAVFRTTLGRATALLGAADGALWLVQPDGKRIRGLLEIRPLGRKGEVLELADHPHSRRASRALVPVLYSRGDVSGVEAERMERMDASALLVAPLVERGRCTGLLQLVYRDGGRWPRPEDIDFAEAIANQCSLAVARARIYELEREARERAELAETEARRVGELQERLAAVVGHDLRTPLAVIRLTVDTLVKRGGFEPSGQRGLARVAASAARMEAIIRDLLDFARTRSAGGIPVSLTAVRLDEVARQAVQELEEATGRSVKLVTQGDPALHGDASRLGQIVSNLVGNAIDHAPAGSLVEVVVDGEGAELRLVVHNGGPPVPADLLPALFQPFRRGSRPREDARSGHLGLGLFIVAEIARAHAGRVTVESAAGAGTTFTVILPRRKPARSP